MALEQSALIIGTGEFAEKVANDLAAGGVRVIIADGSQSANESYAGAAVLANNSEQILVNTSVRACRGTVGDFHVTLCPGKEGILDLKVSAIIIAPEPEKFPNYDEFNLRAEDGVLTISDFETLLQSDASSGIKGKTVVFLSGIKTESTPAMLDRIMQAATLVSTDKAYADTSIHILTGNLKVAGPGLEKRCRENTQRGVLITKFLPENPPEIVRDENGRAAFTYTDELTRMACTLSPDVVVVDETLRPGEVLCDLSRMLSIERGSDGFVKDDNVRRESIFTNRRGILAAGPARNHMSRSEQVLDVSNVVATVKRLLNDEEFIVPGSAEVNNRTCAKCLTCFRVCPHGAIDVGSRVRVVPEACESCGICAGKCPAHAITMGTADAVDVTIARIGEKSNGGLTPSVAVFCCGRSADLARKSAMEKRLPDGMNLIRVPCAGSISREHILKAFSRGADGVVIASCHDGNCLSGQGPQYAGKRIDQVSQLLKTIGTNPDRLAKFSVAANMRPEFFTALVNFRDQIKSLGPIAEKK